MCERGGLVFLLFKNKQKNYYIYNVLPVCLPAGQRRGTDLIMDGVLAEDLRLVSSTHTVSQNCLSLGIGDLVPASGLNGHCAHRQTDTLINTHTHSRQRDHLKYDVFSESTWVLEDGASVFGPMRQVCCFFDGCR